MPSGPDELGVCWMGPPFWGVMGVPFLAGLPYLATAIHGVLLGDGWEAASGGGLEESDDPLVVDEARAACWRVVGPDGRGASSGDVMVENGCHGADGDVVK
jgi:hypothetical protein